LDSLATIQGLNTAGLMVAVRKMSNSEVKCPKAIRNVNKVIS
jgi:hypothetical protein